MLNLFFFFFLANERCIMFESSNSNELIFKETKIKYCNITYKC